MKDYIRFLEGEEKEKDGRIAFLEGVSDAQQRAAELSAAAFGDVVAAAEAVVQRVGPAGGPTLAARARELGEVIAHWTGRVFFWGGP